MTDVPIYNPSLLLGSQEAGLVGLVGMTTFVPSLVIGVALNSNCPLIKSGADNFVLDLAYLSRFNVEILSQEDNTIKIWENLDTTKPIHI